MTFEQANAETVLRAMDVIRGGNGRAPHNIFKNPGELRGLLKKKECLCLRNGKAVLVMIPCHDTYYDVLFIAIDEEALGNIIDEFKREWPAGWPVHVSVIGTEHEAGKIVGIFETAGFSLRKKLARTRQVFNSRCERRNEIYVQMLRQSEQEGSVETDQCKPTINVSCAVPGDEKEILSLLLEEFDPLDDTLPELDDIIEHIRKKEIIVARDNGMLVGIHYFEIINSIYYGIYDMIKKSYRKYLIAFDIGEFRNLLVSEKGITINRYIGWRDTQNRRLMRLSELRGEKCDGVVVYSMKYTTGNPLLAGTSPCQNPLGQVSRI